MKKIITCVVSLLVLFTAMGGILAYRNEWFSSPKRYDENNIGECYFQETEEGHIATDDFCMYADNEILVVAKENVKKSQIEKLAKNYDAYIVGWIEQTGDYQWEMNSIYSIKELESIVSELENENIIDSSSINYISEISESGLPVNYGKEWSGETWDENDHAGSNWGLEAIHALSAWEILEEHKEKVNPIRLGLIDSGFDTDHEDLADCFVDTFYNTSPNDHGTHVAGIMAANSDNDEGICGVYPYGKGNLYGASWSGASSIKENVSIMQEKCCFSELILRNVKVINCSYGGDVNLIYLNGYQTGLEKLAEILEEFFLRILDKGHDFVIVQAAGNESNKFYTRLKVDSDGDVILDKAGKATYDENGEYTKIYYQNGGLAVKGWYYKKDEKSEGKKINGLNTSKDNENVYNSGWAETDYNNYTSLFKNEKIRNRVIVVGSIGIETNHSEALFDQTININRGDSGYHISTFSNLGKRVDVVAPGEKIYSTLLDDKYGAKNASGDMSGTSMAAPHVAGVAAMVWAANNNLTGTEVKEIICSSANNLIGQPGSSYYKTDYKLVDAKSAVEKALGIEKEETTEPQNGGILCWVVNKDNEDEKIEGATVTATNTSTSETFTATSDENGHFELILPEGEYTLTVTADGYEDYVWPDGNNYQNPIVVKNEGVNYLDDWIKMSPITPTPEIVQAVLDNPTVLQDKAEYWSDSYEEILGYSGNEQIWFQDMDMDGDLEFILFSGQVENWEWWNHEFCVYDTDSDGSLHYYQITHQDVACTAMCLDGFYQLYQDTATGSYHYLKEIYYSISLFIDELILEKHTADYDFGSGDMPVLVISDSDTITGSADYTDSHFVGTGPESRFNPSTTLSSLDEIVTYYNSYFENYVGIATTIKSISLSDYLAMSPEEQEAALMESYNAWSYAEDDSIKLPLAEWIQSQSTTPPAFTQLQLDAIGRDLGVPDDLSVSFTQDTPSYWEAGGRWLTFVSIYHNGEEVASVKADSYTAELVSEIWRYSESSDNSGAIPTSAQIFNGHSYMIYDIEEITTWENAKTYCENLGGYLAIISSREENDFLYQYTTGQGYKSSYFGITDTQQEGTWLCVDGSNPSYTNWHSGEPNAENSSEDYGMFYWKFTDGTWNDGNFGGSTVGDGRAFICEWNE